MMVDDRDNRLKSMILSFVFGSFILVGLPLVGWGLSDLHSFFLNSSRMAYELMMVILSGMVVVVVPRQGRGLKEGHTTVQRQKLTIVVLQLCSLMIVIGAPYGDCRGYGVITIGESIRYWGLGLALIGFSLMNWAVMVLDRQFSVEVTIQDGHRLITGGLYRFIRHPRYLGIILFFLGVSLVFRSWMALVPWLATLMVLIWRIGDEELMLYREFKSQWEEYVSHSWKLIPGLF